MEVEAFAGHLRCVGAQQPALGGGDVFEGLRASVPGCEGAFYRWDGFDVPFEFLGAFDGCKMSDFVAGSRSSAAGSRTEQHGLEVLFLTSIKVENIVHQK